MTEADRGLPQTHEEALTLSNARLGIKDDPKPATPMAPPAAAEQPSDAQVVDEVKDGVTNPDGESAAPAAPKPDWSFVADPVLRAALEAANLPAEAHSKFKDWNGDYTRKSQAARANEQKAKAWEELESDPDLFGVMKEAWAAKVSGKKPGAKEPEAFDYATATSAEIEAHIQQITDAKAEAKARSILDSEIKQPNARVAGILSAVEGLYADVKSTLTQEQYSAAWEKARSHYGDGSFTPENATTLFRPILEAEVAKAELARLKTQKAQDAGLALRATTPAGTSGIVKDKAPKVAEAKPDGQASTARAKTLAEIELTHGYTRSQLEKAARFGTGG